MAQLISTEWLATRLTDNNLVVADVRWESTAPDAGLKAFCSGHIPGAAFLDLDTDMADRSDLSRGRHPLPDPQHFALTLARAGIGRNTHVVVYDDKGGSLALRLWWMLRWIGGPDAALLDGGFAKWILEQRPVEAGSGSKQIPAAEPLIPYVNANLVAGMDQLEAMTSGRLLFDARAPERFRGEIEPIDTRAGHIPGALNAPWMENLSGDPDQTFKTPAELRARFEKLDVQPDTDIISSCGSGVTACHNIFALELAGFPGARLYPGSWSEWIVKHLG